MATMDRRHRPSTTNGRGRMREVRRSFVGTGGTFVVVLALAIVGFAGAATAADPVPPAIPPSATWLETVNYYREMAGLPAVTEDPVLSTGDGLHAKYIAETGELGHTEDVASPWYTAAGAAAAATSNVASSAGPLSARTWVELWIEGPFHALGLLDPKLTHAGFGSADAATLSGAALDVISGRDGAAATTPVMWPSDGTTVPLDRYSGGESPDPIASCPGYTAPAGLPILLQLPAAETVTSAAVTTGGNPLESCWFDGTTYVNADATAQALGRSVLASRNAIVVIPKAPLTGDTAYSVQVVTIGASYPWSFRTAVPPPCLSPAYQSVIANGLRFDGFGRGSDNTLCHRVYTGSWSAWESLGGAIAGKPVAKSWGPGRLDVFARGVDTSLRKITYNGAWSAWRNLGGAVKGTPAVASWGPGRLDVFVRGTDDAVWHRWYSTRWSSWEGLGGALVSNPSGRSCGVGCLKVGGNGTDGHYWRRIFRNGLWGPWTPS